MLGSSRVNFCTKYQCANACDENMSDVRVERAGKRSKIQRRSGFKLGQNSLHVRNASRRGAEANCCGEYGWHAVQEGHKQNICRALGRWRLALALRDVDGRYLSARVQRA
jgi:hypothetical protein